MKQKSTLFWLGFTALFPVTSYGQGIGDQRIVIEKDRNVTIPQANRVLDKVPLTKGNQETFKLNYSFFDRKRGINRFLHG